MRLKKVISTRLMDGNEPLKVFNKPLKDYPGLLKGYNASLMPFNGGLTVIKALLKDGRGPLLFIIQSGKAFLKLLKDDINLL